MTPSAIAAVAVVMITAIALFMRNKKNNSKTPEIVQLLMDFASKNGSLITRHDHLSNLAIGHSEADNKIFFLKKVNDKRIVASVNLWDAEKVAVTKATRRSKAGDDVMHSIALDFMNKDRTKPTIDFEFYNLDTDGFAIYGELEMASKWQKLSSELIAQSKS